jgi:hypothetical protein
MLEIIEIIRNIAMGVLGICVLIALATRGKVIPSRVLLGSALTVFASALYLILQ